MEAHCQKYLLLYPRYSKRLKQVYWQHITSIRQIHHTAVERINPSFKITKYEGFLNLHTKRDQLQSFQSSQLRCLSDSSCKFNDLISPANTQRAQKNMQSVKPLRRFPLKKGFRKAAVLIPMCMIDGELSLLLTLRSIHLKNNRRQVSFPGGMMDEDDADETATALRETYEETGLDPKLIDVWGSMLPLSNRFASTEVTPVVGFCRNIDLNSLHLSPNEVEKIFSVTIKGLCDPNYQRTTQMRTGNGYTLPVYLNSPYRIWGLTALIIHQFLTILATDLHCFKIRHQRSIQKI